MEENKKSNKVVIGILIAILALAAGGNVYQFLNSKEDKKEKPVVNSNEEMVNDALDETQDLMQRISMERDLAINQVDSLEIELSEWKLELENLRSQAQNGNMSNTEKNRLLGEISSLKSKVSALLLKEKQIDSLTTENIAFQNKITTQTTKISSLEGKVKVLDSNVNKFSNDNKVLVDKINTATAVQFGGINVYGVDSKKSGERTTFDASKIDEMFVEFRLIGNKLYNKTSSEEIKVRITGPKGELYQKGGTCIALARQEDFTFLETITYNGKSSTFKDSFKPAKKLNKGNYEVEIFDNGTPVQKTTISLY